MNNRPIKLTEDETDPMIGI